ncbi:hypothetical protein A3C09_03975 [Candidatus Uhrbacteria bacterium RIFCSPHIGHO2_02_FULL_47_44]|nr:MAG: hypothetical protein A3C09_03975 [Candidatus Uhrbacteria bacterium RIFCSPHIGHO2_02_FULL_47_44]
MYSPWFRDESKMTEAEKAEPLRPNEIRCPGIKPGNLPREVTIKGPLIDGATKALLERAARDRQNSRGSKLLVGACA